jgi:hypothetical protein
MGSFLRIRHRRSYQSRDLLQGRRSHRLRCTIMPVWPTRKTHETCLRRAKSTSLESKHAGETESRRRAQALTRKVQFRASTLGNAPFTLAALTESSNQPIRFGREGTSAPAARNLRFRLGRSSCIPAQGRPRAAGFRSRSGHDQASNRRIPGGRYPVLREPIDSLALLGIAGV